jgi:hypothetical protein
MQPQSKAQVSLREPAAGGDLISMCSAKLLGWSILLIHGNFMDRFGRTSGRRRAVPVPKFAINAWANPLELLEHPITTVLSGNCFASNQLSY